MTGALADLNKEEEEEGEEGACTERVTAVEVTSRTRRRSLLLLLDEPEACGQN